MALINRIQDIVNPIIETKGAFLIDINLHRAGQIQIIEIYIDTDTGVTTDLCADISREVSRAIQKDDIIIGRYNLVVSSPGLERPLRFLRQYHRNLGRTFTIKFNDADGVKTVTGSLVEVIEDKILLKLINNELIKVNFPSVVEAKVKIIW